MSVHRWRRSTAVVLLATGTTCLAAAALPLFSATADSEPGSGFGSFSLSANAPVEQARFDYAAQYCGAQVAGTGGCEGVINESVSRLDNGPIGYALSSVTWPGNVPGNLGSLIIVASGGQVPQDATALNSPIRAEARTGGPDPVVTDYPGNGAPTAAHMVASATATKVSAQASLGGAQSTPVGSMGASSSSTSTTLTGPKTAQAKAHSEAQDITIGGVVHLGGITADALATTDGTTASGSGKTLVTGASINGIPVTIDEHGVTVQSQGVPFPSQATDAVNTALANAKMSITYSKPTMVHSGASFTYTAGSVVFMWELQSGTTMSVVLGGAQVSVKATPGYGGTGGSCEQTFTCPPPPVTGGTTGGFTGGTTGGSGTAPLVSGVGSLGGSTSTTGGVVPPTVSAPSVTPTAAAFKLPHGLSPWYVVLAMLGSGLVMAGLLRLPTRVLEASSSACPLGESS